jgi:PhoH-like ATPase
MVALPGKAGTGKTLLSLLAGFEQLQTHYGKIIVYRPIISVGQDLGYLPGDEREKFAPWKLPITDNFNLILGSKTEGDRPKKEKGGSCEDFEHYKQLEILPYAYIRGRSIPNIFMIVDESQNIPPKDMKTITSRAGQNTKVVVIGDPDQIDHQYLDSRSNGLCKLIQKMRGQEVFGVITLQRSERSRLSDLVASLL